MRSAVVTFTAFVLLGGLPGCGETGESEEDKAEAVEREQEARASAQVETLQVSTAEEFLKRAYHSFCKLNPAPAAVIPCGLQRRDSRFAAGKSRLPEYTACGPALPSVSCSR